MAPPAASVSRIVTGWMKRLELRREDHIHEDERKQERQAEVETRSLQFLGLAREDGRVPRFHVEFCRRGANDANASVCDPPGGRLASSVTWRCRLSRSMVPGRCPASIRTTLASGTWCPRGLPRKCGARIWIATELAARSQYDVVLLLPSLKVVTSWPAIMKFSVSAMLETLPRDRGALPVDLDAQFRLTRQQTCGRDRRGWDRCASWSSSFPEETRPA